MNGVHDLAGMHGFGPVRPEADEPVFHHPWERAIFGLTIALMARPIFNLDEFRHGIEQMDPAEYLGSSYYEHWLAAIERHLVGKGVITEAELAAKRREFGRAPGKRLPTRRDPALATRLLAVVRRGADYRREPVPPRFRPGDQVMVSNFNPKGHTRLPRYCRAKRGVIESLRGTFVTPDTNAMGLGENPQPLYGVGFDARELWGTEAESNQKVHLDLWENYLEPVRALRRTGAD